MAASRLDSPSERVHPKELTPRRTQYKNQIRNMQLLALFASIGFVIIGIFMLDIWWHALVIPLLGTIIGFVFPIIPICFFKKYAVALMWIHDKMVTYFGILSTIPICVLMVLDFYNISSNKFNIIAIAILYTLFLICAFVLFKKDCKTLEDIKEKKEDNNFGEYTRRFTEWRNSQKPDYKITLDSICHHLTHGEICGFIIGNHYKIVVQRLEDFGLITENIKNNWSERTSSFSTKFIDGLKELTFVFENGKLRYIYLDFPNDNQGAWGWKQIYDSLCKNYGEPLFDREAKLFNWTYSNTIYTLGEESLVVGKLH